MVVKNGFGVCPFRHIEMKGQTSCQHETGDVLKSPHCDSQGAATAGKCGRVKMESYTQVVEGTVVRPDGACLECTCCQAYSKASQEVIDRLLEKIAALQAELRGVKTGSYTPRGLQRRKADNRKAGGTTTSQNATGGCTCDCSDLSASGSEVTTPQNATSGCTVEQLQSMVEDLKADNERYRKANKDLNAKVNRIKAVPAADPKPPKPRGRPKGQKATINKKPKPDRTEIIDCHKCPHCGNPKLAGTFTHYTRVVTEVHTFTENVEYDTRRRYCCKCKKYVSSKPPKVSPYARICNVLSAAEVALGMNGLSSAKVAEFTKEYTGWNVSRSSVHRNKMRVAKTVSPEYDRIQKAVLQSVKMCNIRFLSVLDLYMMLHCMIK